MSSAIRKFACVLFLALILFARAASPAVEREGTQYPFTGTWKLNVKKSTYSPGRAPRSNTITIASDGRVSFEGTDADGKRTRGSHASSVGRQIIFDGAKDLTIETRVADNIIDDTIKSNGKQIQTIHAVFFQNGRIVTVNTDGEDPQGRPIHNHEVYERQ